MRRLLVVLTGVLTGVLVTGCSRGSRNMGDSATPSPARGASPDRHLMEADWGEAEYSDLAGAGEGAADTDRAARPVPSSEEYKAADAVSGPMAEDEPMARGHRRTPAKRESEVARRDPGPDPPRIRQSRIQSGTLTAGSFDDNQRFDDYRQFLSEAMQADAAEKLPRMAIGQRVLIHVTGARGGPVGDARVVVREAVRSGQLSGGEDAAGPVLLDLATASDGRVMFLTGIDRADPSGEYLVTVHPPDGAQPVTGRMHLDQRPWQIALPGTRPGLPRKLDLALVVDTTGSMSDELEYLKVEIDSIAKSIYQMFPGVDQRYSLVVYRDQGDQYVTRAFDFTASLAEFRATLSEQSAQGGGNYPEAMHLALENAGKLDWRDQDTARVLFLVGDAPPHDRFAGRTLEAVEVLRGRGVRVFPVAASGVAMKAEFVMRAAGFLTLGQYLFLTDHSGVGNPHAEPHVPEYQVERLDRLMIRMIASELAGRRLAADEVLAIEGGDLSLPLPDDAPIDQQQQPDLPVQASAGERATFSWLPRWAVLAAAVLGLCVADSVLTRTRS